MKPLNMEETYKQFLSAWEYSESGGRHTPEVWDGRAVDWGKELEKNGSFRRSLDERVQAATQYLRLKGALEENGRVIDIGCGAGRFVVEFARHTKHVTGLDISKNMLTLGEAYAKHEKQENVSFMQEDFRTLDVEALGWEKKFDLVFTSITPAIGTWESLKKVMYISKGFCFNSCFVRWEDELEEQIRRDLFLTQSSSPQHDHGNSFYTLFNLLWLDGYLPQVNYHCQKQEEYVEVDKSLASYYAKCFSEDMASSEEDTLHMLRYLEEHAGDDRKILRKYERWYGWLLWDVRMRR